MKKLALLALGLGAATLAPQAASAQVIINNGGGFHHGGFGGGNFFGGFAFGGFFHQPQFHVQNWQLYGFIQPRHGQRWIRYYDDAYLVDRRGYIHDRRHRVNWDRYGERWARDERGIPYYVGDGDYHPDGRDYQRVDHERRYSSGWDYSGYGSACGRAQRCDDYRGGHGGYVNGHHGGGYDRGGYRVDVRRGGYDRGGYERRESYGHGYSNGYGGGYAPPPPPYGGACGAGYVCGGSAGYGHSGYSSGYSTGYGHGGGTVVITETTVTPGTASTYVTEEIVEEVIEEGTVRRRHAPRRRAAPPARRYHAPAPKPRVIHPRGDRG
ncbi:MAG TPA: RcnB family protein [Allosphingosinicella sp.]|nr:RcnB family protein [Allosphingosinicella sp.]